MYIHLCIYIYIYTHLYVYIYVCVPVCACACVHMYTQTFSYSLFCYSIRKNGRRRLETTLALLGGGVFPVCFFKHLASSKQSTPTHTHTHISTHPHIYRHFLTHTHTYRHTHPPTHTYGQFLIHSCPHPPTHKCTLSHGVATVGRLLKSIGLLCKRALQKRPIFCKRDLQF